MNRNISFDDVKGMDIQKGLFRHAAQAHLSVFLLGPPGCGKTMLARCVKTDAPFRAPHHTVSSKSFEGELALAEGGVLYLDEVSMFDTPNLERALAQHAEKRFMLVASSNLCECGWLGTPRSCVYPCSGPDPLITAIAYQFDLVIPLRPVNKAEL